MHYVLDEWFAAEVQPRLRGPSTLVRFADDFVVILAHKDDAERVLRVLGKRLGKYGLELHPNKTQMIDFRFKPQSGHDDPQEPLATTFNFPRIHSRVGDFGEGPGDGAAIDRQRPRR
ncbi:reverse transcriptase domain-containing protein, partial [Caballeronia arationis]|uniref:reverse transcriptase domain-containing protein n=1 Tax=Caballeronia arationis TaxID=1777142 RepID=UPI0022869C8C